MSANWKKAPDGATHYGPKSKQYSACWYKKVDGVWHFQKEAVGNTWHPMQSPPTVYRFGRMEVRP
ncbi:hypothetical protein [Pseudomonas chlororaphis]|uniref:hypothetical protein n=1 Tax=Pseudomonas chlororaphis TaxID=587753 RepID=UPI003C1ACD75